jgi:hypothetical protein
MAERRKTMDLQTQTYLDDKFEKVFDLISKQNEKTAVLSQQFAVYCASSDAVIKDHKKRIEVIEALPEKGKANRWQVVGGTTAIALAIIDFIGLMFMWLGKKGSGHP